MITSKRVPCYFLFATVDPDDRNAIITIEMDRDRALDLISQLVNGLRDKDRQTVQCMVSGKLERQ